ncbi:NUDIX domain-containing protein, partial [Galactobacillus timonensis]|nr:NUDIX hydrolase [Galactobacillus timonensis]
MNLRETIEAYQPYNEQEERDRQQMLYLLDHEKDLLLRKNTSAHFSASAWVVSHDREHVLLCWHNIYRSWSWLGGHADGEEDLLSVAVREVRE